MESLPRGAVWQSIVLETPDIQPVALDDKIYLLLLWSIRRLLHDIGNIGNGKFGTFGWLMDRKDNVCSYMFRLFGRNKDCNCFWSGYHIHEDQNALDGCTSVLTRKVSWNGISSSRLRLNVKPSRREWWKMGNISLVWRPVKKAGSVRLKFGV